MTASAPSYIPTKAELVDKARELVPTLKKRAAKAEELCRMPDETIADVKAAGFNKIYMPKRFGGYEMDWGAHYEVGRELGRACGSTAWTVSLVFSHIIWVARFHPEAQEEFFAKIKDPLVSTGTAGHSVLEEADGGYRLSGRWKFVSGVHHADCAVVGARVDPEAGFSHWVLLYPDDYTIIETWNTEGLRGTGSHDIEVKERFLPAHRVVGREEFMNFGSPGAKLHDHYVYRMRMAPLQRSWFAAPLVGPARGALEEYCTITKTRTGRMFGERIVDQVPVQVRVGESLAEIEMAELIIDTFIRFLHERGASGNDLLGTEVLKARRDMTVAARLCVRATTRLAEMMGAGGQERSNPVQRHMRDCRMVATHIELQWDHAMAPIGRYLLGLPTGDPFVDTEREGSGGASGALVGA